MKYFVSLLVYIIGLVTVWNICDFLFCTFITQSEYQFSISADMITPLVVLGYLFMLADRLLARNQVKHPV